MKYILASGSPRRKALLAQAGLTFGICVPKAAEVITPHAPPAQCAMDIASQKAAYVAGQFPEDCVIAADTLVVAAGQILGKPNNQAEAAAMLRLLSGGVHEVITGVCLCQRGDQRHFFQETKVWFYSLGDDEIEAYVRTGEPMDKAGAYGIQGRGALLVERVEGDYCNVVGLPIARLVRELRAMAAP